MRDIVQTQELGNVVDRQRFDADADPCLDLTFNSDADLDPDAALCRIDFTIRCDDIIVESGFVKKGNFGTELF